MAREAQRWSKRRTIEGVLRVLPGEPLAEVSPDVNI
ncbi:hypothetical protein METESE_09620 [Mesoterricola sediminis]|uniref:Uncharacterized protein n=1 Tax=Mesoterricola sediminis TaxID=2927980 RepID=A0AA48GTN9_9BACT|nr:hypothetical protein METESE_09620 [Mesoterricola sediminis]